MSVETYSPLQYLLPELVILLPEILPTSALRALVGTCKRLHTILQAALDSRMLAAGRSVLIWACQEGKTRIVERLLGELKFAYPENDFPSPVFMALLRGHGEFSQLLRQYGGSEDLKGQNAKLFQCFHQPLHLAAQNLHLGAIRVLLAHGAPINDDLGEGGTPLHYAISYNYPSPARDAVVELLLANGADVEHATNKDPALVVPVKLLDVGLVKLLLERGANAEASVDLYAYLCSGRVFQPQHVNLLYAAIAPPHTRLSRRANQRYFVDAVVERWPEEPEEERERRREVMGLLLKHGASKSATLGIFEQNLTALAAAAGMAEGAYRERIQQMLAEAEGKINAAS